MMIEFNFSQNWLELSLSLTQPEMMIRINGIGHQFNYIENEGN